MPQLFLLDFDPGSGLSETLRAILESSGLGRLELRRPAGPEPSLETDRLDIVLAVLPPALVQQPAALVESVRRQAPEVPIVAVLERGEPDEVLGLLRLGVQDFLVPPLRPVDVLPRVRRLLERAQPRAAVVSRLKQRLGLRHLVGETATFLAAMDKVPLVARCDATVLISGETGTGKELVARAVHYLSPRAKLPFIAVNCGAIPAELVENELFGHERSAYTGATGHQTGLIQEAEGGTLFLDEVDGLPLLAQVTLLRFLQEKEYRPLGAGRLMKADVRVVAAANSDIEDAVAAGRLRQDLYYRLSVIPLHLPALRERHDDIPLLARHFLAKYAVEMGQPARDLSPSALQALLAHPWPGNVRELEHVMQRAVVLAQDHEAIGLDQIVLSGLRQPEASGIVEGFRQAKARVVAQFESAYIRDLLLAHQGNISRAAKSAEKDRRAFWELVRKYGIDAKSFRSV